jgi:hypothetical protein
MFSNPSLHIDLCLAPIHATQGEVAGVQSVRTWIFRTGPWR